ncbi:ATP-binding protein [Crenothrix polyspora]|jgi:serine/threonine-protein kinase RsbW|uniref:Putative anti-sigma regulatory factor, serine/threonine protein kinase n=1 Tax=Crenothrix polyspora TaxID=360316 RepID=A0A1R4HD18_9GAMM|nr:ATP-binding protein [Crenothrix polyspora]SJM94107.1 putative anti-sigma regulatory factor, serine/threonine protein kinase [Crenothrix polyspora]
MCIPLLQVDVVIPTETKYLDLIGCIGERIAKKVDGFTGDREALAYQLNLVLTEATANAIKHASDDDLQHTVRISIHLHSNALHIKVYDYGQGFDLDTVPIPDFEHPQESGMGLFFIRSLMDSVTYTRQADYNVLEIIKYLK